MPKKPLDRRGGISRANDLALLAAGIETGWWDEHGMWFPPKRRGFLYAASRAGAADSS